MLNRCTVTILRTDPDWSLLAVWCAVSQLFWEDGRRHTHSIAYRCADVILSVWICHPSFELVHTYILNTKVSTLVKWLYIWYIVNCLQYHGMRCTHFVEIILRVKRRCRYWWRAEGHAATAGALCKWVLLRICGDGRGVCWWRPLVTVPPPVIALPLWLVFATRAMILPLAVSTLPVRDSVYALAYNIRIFFLSIYQLYLDMWIVWHFALMI